MKEVKAFGLGWKEFICIIAAVIVGQEATDFLKVENCFLDLIIFFIGWFIGYAVCYYLIKFIQKWTGKN